MSESFRMLPASHAAVAVGLADWSTPLATYFSIRDARSWATNPEEPVKGVRLAQAMRDWASSILEREFHAPRADAVAGGRLHFLKARPNGVTAAGDVVLLLKTPLDLARYRAVQGGDEEDVEEMGLTLPRDVLLECATYQAVMKPRELWVGVLVGGQLKMLQYTPSETYEGTVITVLSGYWRTNVVEERPPGAKVGDEALLRELFPRARSGKGDVKFSSLDDKHKEAVLEFCKAQRSRTAAQATEKKTRPLVVEALADYGGMCDFPSGSGITSISFEGREPHANNGTWKAIAAEYLASCSPQKKAALLKKYTPEVGTRVLRPFFS
jgi:hypothetical protein